MRVYRKTIQVLGLSRSEIDMLMEMVIEARAGQVVNYAERQTGPGLYFGISIADEHSRPEPPIRAPKAS